MTNLLRQPFAGSTTLVAAAISLAVVWRGIVPWSPGIYGPATLPLAAGLAGALMLTVQFPIHIQRNTKIYMGSVLLYLIAALLPAPLAGLAAFAGVAGGELLVRKQRDLYLTDMASQAGRWTVLAVLGSLVAHVIAPHAATHPLALAGTAVVLWVGDILTAPLVLTPMSGESPAVIIRAIVLEAGLIEAGEYLIGILGAIAATQQLWALILLAPPTAMVYITSKRGKELQTTTQVLLEHMADTVDLRDPYTGGHSRRVTAYVSGIFRAMGMVGPEVDLTVAAARLHDIGKIGMPDRVLLKDDRLSDEEWEIMKLHPEQGADLLMRYPDFSRGAEIVRHHHESWDGTGYPHRLREHTIPFGSRIIAVADSYDAMTSDRPYRKGMSPDKAAAILREGRGRQWDGVIVDAFLRSIAEQLEQPVAPMLRVVPAEDGALSA